MDELQERLIRIALGTVADREFVLGGGFAVQLHGMGDRPSEDIELFTTRSGTPARSARISWPRSKRIN